MPFVNASVPGLAFTRGDIPPRQKQKHAHDNDNEKKSTDSELAEHDREYGNPECKDGNREGVPHRPPSLLLFRLPHGARERGTVASEHEPALMSGVR